MNAICACNGGMRMAADRGDDSNERRRTRYRCPAEFGRMAALYRLDCLRLAVLQEVGDFHRPACGIVGRNVRNLLAQGVFDRTDAEIELLVLGMRSGIAVIGAVLPANRETTRPNDLARVVSRRTR
jgi:hypothetical protein